MFKIVSLSNCPKCRQVKSLLEKMEVKLEEINGMDHPELLEEYKIQAAPVIINTETKSATYVGDCGSKKLKEVLGLN